jgi:4-phospho-D-threonate 3-dehydrogenase / 4-phospho-D-erythronate 3-dehydrogenase
LIIKIFVHKQGIRKTVGITIGDAAGIGPEISLKAVAAADLCRDCRPVLIGDLAHLRKISKRFQVPIELVPYSPEGANIPHEIEVIDTDNLPANPPVGVDDAVTGRAAAECIEAAVRLCDEGAIAAMATAPISKKAIALGGYGYPGHTEFLAELTGTTKFAMSFFAERLRVVLLSTHVSLRNAIELVTTHKLIETIRFANDQLGDLLNRPVSLAVAGLNPHASEQGMFGDEEAREIVPAIERCREEFGIDVSGPYSPDTIFLRGYKGEFDAVIACYHDQATIAVKSLSFGASVNVTLGLPIIRTSVDHGTAYDIAGKGIADASSMKAAIRLAAELALVART